MTYGKDERIDQRMFNYDWLTENMDVMIDVNYYVKSTKEDFEHKDDIEEQKKMWEAKLNKKVEE